MNDCYADGSLRAYLDGEQEAAVMARIEQHLAGCPECQARLDAVRLVATTTGDMLAAATIPHAGVALEHFRQKFPEPAMNTRSTRMTTPNPRKSQRRWLAPLGAILAMVALLALPPIRAAADQLLQIFRVQSVVFVPVSEDRMRELERLNFDGKSLFVAEPKLVNQPADPRTVTTADEAAQAVGFGVQQPAALPEGVSLKQIQVTDRTITEFQVNVESARQLISLAGVTDVSLPDSLGAQPITVNLPPAVMTSYQGNGTSVSLMQARSPEISLPDGVDLSQLGRVALRVLGMAPEQADALASQIDWSSTLLVPFPADLNTIRQVSINGAPGMVMTGGQYSSRNTMLYWQRGDQIYVLQVEGTMRGDEQAQQAVVIAESIR